MRYHAHPRRCDLAVLFRRRFDYAEHDAKSIVSFNERRVGTPEFSKRHNLAAGHQIVCKMTSHLHYGLQKFVLRWTLLVIWRGEPCPVKSAVFTHNEVPESGNSIRASSRTGPVTCRLSQHEAILVDDDARRDLSLSWIALGSKADSFSARIRAMPRVCSGRVDLRAMCPMKSRRTTFVLTGCSAGNR